MVSFDPTKTLPLIFFPLSLSLLLLMGALKWRNRILIVVPLVILGSLSTPLLANLILGSLEDRYPYRSVQECTRADAVFVFGGMLDPRDRTDGSIAWSDAAERFDRAVRLMEAGKAGFLVFSGGASRYPHGNEGDLLKREAAIRGIPEQSLLVTGNTSNTKSEADDMCHLASQMGWKRILIVTSAYHMPRVMRLSSNCQVERIPVPVAYRTPDPSTSWAQRRLEFYLPQAQGLLDSELALHEYLGMFLYSRKHS